MDKCRSGDLPPQSDLLGAALEYVRRGLAVIPVRPGAKEPRSAHGCRDASRDTGQVRRWWGTWPDANLGIVTGKPSQLLVVDIDRKPNGPDGEESFLELVRATGPLPETWEAQTGGGGRHLYYRIPAGTWLASAVRVLPGLDIRGEGGYVVAPPSLHISGRRYTWELSHHPDEMPLAELPAALSRFLIERTGRPPPHAPAGKERIPEGSRNAALTRLAGMMRRRGMTKEAITAALVVENHVRCIPPLPEAEVRRIAQSIMRYSPVTSSETDEPDRSTLSADELRVVPLADIAESRPRWLWKGRIPFGCVSIIEGPPGVGKTTLALAISSAVTRGRPLPGGSEALTPSNVLICSAEDSAGATLRPRAVAHDADLARLHVLASLDGGRLPTLPNDVTELGRLVDHHRARLLILDPLMAFFDSEINAYRDQDVRRAIAPLSALADRTGCAVLLLRHLTKDGTRPAIYRGGGSVGIIAAARSALVVGRDDQDPSAFVVASVKNNLSREEPSLRYRLEPVPGQIQAKLVWIGEVDVDADRLGDDGGERSSLDEAVRFLRVELSNGPKPGKRVQTEAREAGISDATLRRARQILGVRPQKQGFEGGRWIWQLPEGAQSTNMSTFDSHSSGSNP